MLKSIIQNGLGKKLSAEVTDDNALKVATTQYKTLTGSISAFVNPTYGLNMAINASPATPTEVVYNGTDTTSWMAASISGSWDFASTAQAHSGTKSVDGTQTSNGDIADFFPGYSFNLDNFTQLTGWIYITAWSSLGTKELNIYGWDISDSSQVGEQSNIANYVNINELNVWQKFIIPFSDINLGQEIIEALRVETIDTGPGPPINFYLDDLEIEGGAGSQEYIIQPPISQKFFISHINLFIVDDYDSTLADATMPKLVYNQLLGETFITGFIFRVVNDGKITFAVSVKDIEDIMMIPAIENFTVFSDGGNTSLQFNFVMPELIELDSRTEDRISILITEDFSTLVKMASSAAYKVETI